MKKGLSLILALLMISGVSSIFRMTVSAEDDILNYLSYRKYEDRGEVYIVDCDKSVSGEVIIPDSIEGYPVTYIGEAFFGCNYITSVTIPDTVIGLFEGLFSGCSNLKSINLGNGITRIEQFMFTGCKSLESINIPDNVTTIGLSAFDNCSGLEFVEIGKGLSYIEDNAFAGCINLKKFIVDEENLTYSSDEHGVLFDKDKTMLIEYPQGNISENYIVPEGVETIYYGAFSNCSFLKNVELPASTIRVYNSFEGTSLEKIVFNNKNCIIDFEENFIPSTAVIHGYKGSLSESYAKTYDRDFVAIDDDLFSVFVRFFESFSELFNKLIVMFKNIFGIA